MKTTHLDMNAVRERARGRWPSIFDALGIEVGTGKHRPCPVCGGRDRFRCDNKNGSGSWFCNQCEPHAGDGFALVMNVRGCDFPEALRLVAGILGLDASTTSARLRPRLQLSRPCVDRIAVAFHFELAALDLRLRSARIIGAGKTLTVASLTDHELDQALAHVAQAHADVERAELFEHVADGLKTKEFLERHYEQKRAA
jgi:hypothetical protein